MTTNDKYIDAYMSIFKKKKSFIMEEDSLAQDLRDVQAAQDVQDAQDDAQDATDSAESSSSAKSATVNGVVIELKDWERAKKINEKGSNAATAMRKLTKDKRKLLARAACLFAVCNKKKKYNDALSAYKNDCKKLHVEGKDLKSLWSLEELYAETLLNHNSQDIEVVKHTELSDLPFKEAVDLDKSIEEQIKQVNEYREALSGALEDAARKKAELEKQLQDKEAEIAEWAKTAQYSLIISYSDGKGWSYETSGGRIVKIGNDFQRLAKFLWNWPELVYWKLNKTSDTSSFTDRYDFSVPREIDSSRHGFTVGYLLAELKNIDYTTVTSRAIVYKKCQKLLREHKALLDEIAKL